MTDPSSNALVRVESTDTGGERGREYRKGIWTLEETIILLEAKKQDDERRMRDGDKERGKTAELRWKWVENYCFKHGCVRSQNQCNDKWDNLLRDYKKVREYENRLGHGRTSYWQLENHERKDRGLPSNLLYQVYDALHEIVDKRYAHKITHAHASGENPSMSLQEHEQQRQHTSQPNLSQQQQQQQTLPTHQQISTHQQQQQKQQQQQQQPASGGCSIEMSDSSESDTSELPHSPAHSDDSHICCQAQGLARLNRRLETLIGKVNEQKMKQRRLTAAVDDGFAQLEADLQSIKEEVAAQQEEDARKRNTQPEIIQALSERIFSMEVQVGTMSFEEQVRKEVGGASGSTSKTGPAG